LVERLVRNEKARGSNPLTSTNFRGRSELAFTCPTATRLKKNAPERVHSSKFVAIFNLVRTSNHEN
jgi:hypothetical protein